MDLQNPYRVCFLKDCSIVVESKYNKTIKKSKLVSFKRIAFQMIVKNS